MSDIDEALDALPTYYGATGEPMVKLSDVRQTLERQRIPQSHEYSFQRYVNGRRMAEGVAIENAKSLQEAIEKAVRICPRRLLTVLVLAAAPEPNDIEDIGAALKRVGTGMRDDD